MADMGWSLLYSQTHRDGEPRMGKRQNYMILYLPDQGEVVTVTSIASSEKERREYPYSDKVCEARDVMGWIYFEDQLGPVPFESVGRQISNLPEDQRGTALSTYLHYVAKNVTETANMAGAYYPVFERKSPLAELRAA